MGKTLKRAMKATQPYQPLLLRLLHGVTAVCLIAALVTAYWTYDTYDGRWGRIPLPRYPDIEGIHGTFGLWTLLIFPGLVMYAFHRGQRRLLQPDSIAKLAQVGKPIWWYTLHRAANTFILLALAFAVFSGKMMDETWLPQGELNHIWYYAHLISWGVMAGAIALHLLLSAKVGGLSFWRSMLPWRWRPQDRPQRWPQHLTAAWQAVRSGTWQQHWPPLSSQFALEIAILLSVAIAWVIPLFK